MPLTKNATPTLHASPSALKAYLLAARPKTWIASLSPVVIGSSLAPQVDMLYFTLTLLFGLLIQVGTNYVNDCLDFLKGADSPLRQGPKRAVQEGWISPQAMWLAALFVFALALSLATPLIYKAGLWSLPVALLCALFGILYTAGPFPLAYLGLGEVFVFFFFGPLACIGSYFLQTDAISYEVIVASLIPGLLSCSLLIANNLRDREADQAAGKKTLIVRFGLLFGQIEYALCFILSGLATLLLGLNLPMLAFLVAFLPMEKLKKSALLQIVYTLLFYAALRL